MGQMIGELGPPLHDLAEERRENFSEEGKDVDLKERDGGEAGTDGGAVD